MNLNLTAEKPRKEFLLDNKWTFTVFVLLIGGASCISYQYAMGTQGRIPFFNDIILDQTNGVIDICLIIPFVWLMFTGNSTSYIYRETQNTISVIKNILGINIVCLLSFILVNLAVYLLLSGFKNPFINYWLADNQIYRMGFSPMEASCVSLLLLYIRMTFMTILSLTINTMTNSRIYGVIAVLIICLVEWGGYTWFKIYEPIGILPIEHSRIVYTEGYAPMGETDTRISFQLTMLYWVVLYTVGLVAFIHFRKKGAQNE